MSQEFNEDSGIHVERDANGVARNLVHDPPYVVRGQTTQVAAREYLDRFAAQLSIKPSELENLGSAPERWPSDAGVEYRLVQEKSNFDITSVAFAQTDFGLPVFQAGLVVHLQRDPLRVVGAQSTVVPDLHVAKPTPAGLKKLDDLDEAALAPHLALGAHPRNSLRIERKELLIYGYRSERRTQGTPVRTEDPRPPGQEPVEEKERLERAFSHGQPTLALPAVAKAIEDNHHYVCAEVHFVLRVLSHEELHWVAMVEAETLSVLYLRALTDSVGALVYEHDPITTLGAAGPPTSATNAALDPLRTAVTLPGLVPPAGGVHKLVGNHVQVVDVEPPPVVPPTEPSGTDFNFHVRTNDFAAANAYYQCDRFFRLMKDLGFDLATYFGGTDFPTSVDHRGSISTLTGDEINAHCVGNGTFGVARTTFMLADLTNVANPVGIAADWRVVLHELSGHAVLYNQINGPNFLFSHSAGDGIGAILSDPESQAPDRFQSFPWLYFVIQRRHDRLVSAGWGWNGQIALNPFNPVLDPGGYNNEQILATTHFRIYRSIGGDSPELAVRRFASFYVPYLILRAIRSITPAANPPDGQSFAALLQTVDQGNWTAHKQVGGCYRKVIRWAFEQQGAYQAAATPKPNNLIGEPPPVDVYVDDGRHGEYHFHEPFWQTTDVWNRIHPDGQATHQTPLVGSPNYAYVRIKNRGTKAANGVVVRGYHCRPTAGLIWPDDWRPMHTPAITVAGSVASGGEQVVGPFEWVPTHHGHESMFMSATAPGDRANTDATTLLPCAIGPTPMWRLVPNDNNLGLRSVVPVPGGGGRRALVKAFFRRRFWAQNPFPDTGKVEVRAVLPAFLTSRGWSMTLHNAGGGSFSLGPHAHRVIRPRLVGGSSFTEANVYAAGTVSIRILVLVNDLLVGGITYVLDPLLKHPAPEKLDAHPHHHKPELVFKEEKRPRRIKFEVDID